mmetsp:Transcript_37374/g.94277  ORF Transcript_37374/g.94277 Transcript_37374/m.94277 type:complete len:260 (-) Transcript_37374:537-1316(-)
MVQPAFNSFRCFLTITSAGSLGLGSRRGRALVDLDVQQRRDLIAADGALVGLRLERAGAAVAHAHVAAWQRRGVARRRHADDALVALHVLKPLHAGGQAHGGAAAVLLHAVDLLQLIRLALDPDLLLHHARHPLLAVALHPRVRGLALYPGRQLAARRHLLQHLALRAPLVRQRLHAHDQRVHRVLGQLLARWGQGAAGGGQLARVHGVRGRGGCVRGRELLLQPFAIADRRPVCWSLACDLALAILPCIHKREHPARS